MPASAAVDAIPVLPPLRIEPGPNPVDERVEGAALPLIPPQAPLAIPKLPPIQMAKDESNEKIFWIFVAIVSFIASGFCLFCLIPAGIALARLGQMSMRPSQKQLLEDRENALLLQRESLALLLTQREGARDFETRALKARIETIDWELTKNSLSLRVEIDKERFD